MKNKRDLSSQTIFIVTIIFPLMAFAQMDHEGHSIQSHSFSHWLITGLFLSAIFGVFTWYRKSKN